MGRNTRFARTASEDDLTQADVAFMFADNEDMASLPATTTTTATATTTTDTVGMALSSSSSPNSPGSGLYTAASTFTTTATTTTTGAASATTAPTKPAKRAPRSQHTAPPELPATAAQVIDLASFSNLVTALATTIVKAVQDGKSVTAPNKRLIILAAEETRRAMAAFERVTASTTSSQPNATSVAPPAPPAPSARNTTLGPPAAALPILADEANSSLKRELAACVRAEFGKLKAELSQDVRRAAARAPSGPTYAQMVRTQHQPQPQQQLQQQHQQQRAAAPFNTPPPIRATRPAIVVSTKATATSRQQTVEAFRRSISFRASNYAPARVQPVSQNKLRVEFDTDQQRDDALLRLGDASEVTAEPARTLRPMLILKGISKSIPPNELIDIVRRQNNCTDGELALKFERKNRNENLYSAVLVASPDVWRKLVDMGRVCVDHQRVHVERFSPFVQCFACLQFGHVRKNCVPTAPKPCAFCASATHQELDCPVKGDKNNLKCYNCNNRNTKYNNNDPINHKATSGSCSVLRAMRARVESRVDYGLP